MNKVMLLVGAVACLAVISGCAQRSLVGTWESPGRPSLEFTADQKAKAVIEAPGLPVRIEFSGDFAIVDRTTLQLSNVTLTQDGRPVEGFLAELARGVMDANQSYTLDWTSDQQITLTGPGILSGTWTRQAP